MNMTNMLNAKPTSFTSISLLPLFFFSFLCRHIRSVSLVVFESPVVQRKCRNTVSIKTRHQVRGTLILDCEKLLHVENWFRTSYLTRRDEHKFRPDCRTISRCVRTELTSSCCLSSVCERSRFPSVCSSGGLFPPCCRWILTPLQ